MSDLTIERCVGAELAPLVPELAALRSRVFREYPYLYDGSESYEAEYLETYVRTPESLCVVVRDGDRIVGASTGLPMEEADAAFRRPFERQGIDPGSVFYFGESVLLATYRGQGVGHAFFDEREAYARSLGRFTWTAFCAVKRDEDDPRRPDGYRALDGFWMKRGYEKRPDLAASYDWKEVGMPGEREHTMVFWMRPL